MDKIDRFGSHLSELPTQTPRECGLSLHWSLTRASPPTAVSKSEGLRNRNSSNYNKTEFQPKPVNGPGAQTDLKRVKKMTNDAAKYQELEVTWLRGLEFKIIPRQMWARLWSRPVLSITGRAIRSLNLEFYLHCGARPA